MAATARAHRSYDEFEEAYDSLLGSPDSPATFDQNSDEQQVKQVHDDCEIRLGNIIRLLDTGISQHLLNSKNLSRISRNFREHIQTNFNKIHEDHFKNKITVEQNFTEVKEQLAIATAARRVTEGTSPLATKQKHNELYYDSLLKGIEKFEIAFQFWRREDSSPQKQFSGPHIGLIKELNKQKDIFGNISKFFYDTDPNDIASPSIKTHEERLRAIIACLLYTIPEQQIESVAKREILIPKLRELKKWLNLTLDEFKLWEKEGDGGVDVVVFKHLRKCEDCCYEVERIWTKK